MNEKTTKSILRQQKPYNLQFLTQKIISNTFAPHYYCHKRDQKLNSVLYIFKNVLLFK